MREELNRDALLDGLSEDLAPVRPRWPAGAAAALWLVLSWAFVVAATLATGPMRPDFAEQLAASPRFVLEVVAGVGVGIAAIVGALRLAVPGAGRPSFLLALTLAGAALWAGLFAFGLFDPALEPSMLGKREHCSVETFLFSAAPLVGAIFLMRRRAVLLPVPTALLAGLAAASLPAGLMQLACMYAPEHVLLYHVLPAVAVAAGAAVAGRWLLPRL